MALERLYLIEVGYPFFDLGCRVFLLHEAIGVAEGLLAWLLLQMVVVVLTAELWVEGDLEV